MITALLLSIFAQFAPNNGLCPRTGLEEWCIAWALDNGYDPYSDTCPPCPCSDQACDSAATTGGDVDDPGFGQSPYSVDDPLVDPTLCGDGFCDDLNGEHCLNCYVDCASQIDLTNPDDPCRDAWDGDPSDGDPIDGDGGDDDPDGDDGDDDDGDDGDDDDSGDGGDPPGGGGDPPGGDGGDDDDGTINPGDDCTCLLLQNIVDTLSSQGAIATRLSSISEKISTTNAKLNDIWVRLNDVKIDIINKLDVLQGELTSPLNSIVNNTASTATQVAQAKIQLEQINSWLDDFQTEYVRNWDDYFKNLNDSAEHIDTFLNPEDGTWYQFAADLILMIDEIRNYAYTISTDTIYIRNIANTSTQILIGLSNTYNKINQIHGLLESFLDDGSDEEEPEDPPAPGDNTVTPISVDFVTAAKLGTEDVKALIDEMELEYDLGDFEDLEPNGIFELDPMVPSLNSLGSGLSSVDVALVPWSQAHGNGPLTADLSWYLEDTGIGFDLQSIVHGVFYFIAALATIFLINNELRRYG